MQSAPEIPAEEEMVSAYNDVFSVRGGASVVKHGRHVQYTEDLLRKLVSAPAFQPLDLSFIRSLPRDQFLRLLFKSVAGHIVAGPSSLRTDVCSIVVDPVSGTLDLTRDGGQNEVVLQVISLVLLIVLGVMLYKKQQA